MEAEYLLLSEKSDDNVPINQLLNDEPIKCKSGLPDGSLILYHFISNSVLYN